MPSIGKDYAINQGKGHPGQIKEGSCPFWMQNLMKTDD